MTSDVGMTYPFSQTGPITVLLRRSAILSVLIGTCVMVGFVLAGALPVLYLPFAEVVVVASSAAAFWLVPLQYERGFAMITPSYLLIKSWMSRREIPWHDVRSVAVERLQSKNRLGQFVGGLVWGRDCPTFVKISLRRWFQPRRSLLSGSIPMKMLAVYLQEPERFVEEAQQYLTPVTG